MEAPITLEQQQANTPLSALDRAALEVEILRAFQGNIQPVQTPLTYRLGILLVALVMLILPVIYLGITALVGYAVYYHIINDTAILSMGSGRGQLYALLLYLAPIVIGAILVLFMFKPIFSRPPKPPVREPLRRDQEPLLYAFVERVCTAVGAPRPKRIELDCEVNASASFRRGFLSMFSNDLTLTIGTPLVAGLTLREFAGLLAHEFGHFAQGAGMRLTYLIRSISHWFTRVVYERDAWDERLIVWSNQADIRVGWVIYLARFFVWLTRKILWVLMVIGHAVSSFMLRQMEFDADRHETRLAGSAAFESTMRKVVSLSIAARGAHKDLGDFYREGRLADNLPRLILHNINQFTPEVHSKINEMMAVSSTNFFATHPCEKDRIACARRENAAGIFQLEAPAMLLFDNFEGYCEQATWEFYRTVLGPKLKREEIHAIDDLLARQGEEQADFQALQRFLQETFRGDRSLTLPSHLPEPTTTLELLAQQVAETRTQMTQAVANYKKSAPQEGQPLTPSVQAQLEAELNAIEVLTGQRLLANLQLLHNEEIARKLTQAAQWQEESRRLLPILALLNKQVDALKQLHQGNIELAGTLQALRQNQGNRTLVEAALQQRDANHNLISDIRRELNQVDYPFEHAQGKVALGTFILAETPQRDHIGGIFDAAQHLIESVSRLRARLTGRLCLIAEQVEMALGLNALLVSEKKTDSTHNDE